MRNGLAAPDAAGGHLVAPVTTYTITNTTTTNAAAAVIVVAIPIAIDVIAIATTAIPIEVILQYMLLLLYIVKQLSRPLLHLSPFHCSTYSVIHRTRVRVRVRGKLGIDAAVIYIYIYMQSFLTTATTIAILVHFTIVAVFVIHDIVIAIDVAL